jgi:hypothetical protein
LIGRNFVPLGSLGDRSNNFIFRACVSCNGDKADAERHISSVTLFNSPERTVDSSIDALALHKGASDYHPFSRGLVKDAFVESEVRYGATNFQATFNIIAPPQIDTRAVRLLATRQIQAMFCLGLTEDPLVREKTFLLDERSVVVFGEFGTPDWGSAPVMEVTRRTAAWATPFALVDASGFFKAIVRQSPDPSEGYFWALEWNGYLRVFGAIACSEDVPQWLRDLPPLRWMRVSDGVAVRTETPLPKDRDTLFLFEPLVPARSP